jgi:hypothetical protein
MKENVPDRNCRSAQHRPNVNLRTFLLVSLLFLNQAFADSDGFSEIQCGSDIAKALVGKHMSNEKIVNLEKKHTDLRLKDLGATEISQRLSCISWLICGSEFMLLQDKSVVRDVLKVPPHSKSSPEFIGTCEINGEETKTIVVAILDNEKQAAGETLPAKIAWKIDQKKMKFVSLPTDGLRCSRSGISTLDGGL